MSKYNNITSIPIESIPKEELAQAIHEWAEGDEAMERLLWSCYNHGIETSGCHAGADPFLGFYLNNETENISRILNTTNNIPFFQILLSPDGGNPFSGPNWQKPMITIGVFEETKEKADNFFNSVTDSLENQTNGEYNPLLSLFDFFKGKNSLLTFRLRNLKDRCIFRIEMSPASKELSDFYQELFTRAGLKRSIISEEHESNGRYSWILEDTNMDMLYIKIDQARKIIEEGYSLRPPLTEDDMTSFTTKARHMKEHMSEEAFKRWIEEKREEMQSGIKKRS